MVPLPLSYTLPLVTTFSSHTCTSFYVMDFGSTVATHLPDCHLLHTVLYLPCLCSLVTRYTLYLYGSLRLTLPTLAFFAGSFACHSRIYLPVLWFLYLPCGLPHTLPRIAPPGLVAAAFMGWLLPRLPGYTFNALPAYHTVLCGVRRVGCRLYPTVTVRITAYAAYGYYSLGC